MNQFKRRKINKTPASIYILIWALVLSLVNLFYIIKTLING